MLQNLRDQTQSSGFKILIGLIVFALVFGFGVSGVFGGGEPTIAEVGDFEINQNVLALEAEREKMRRLSRAGPDFDPASMDTLEIQQSALNQLINRQVLYQTAADLGVAVGPDVVNDELVNAEAYQVNGQFNEALYRQQLQALRYTPVGFVDEFANALGTEQLQNAIVDSASMPEWELAEIIRVVNQRRDLAYLMLSVDDYVEDIEVSDEEISLRYEEDQTAYMTELAVDAQYLELSIDDLIDDPSISILAEDLQAAYEADRQAALGDEQRDSAHILVAVNDDRNEAAALALITEVQTRLQEGEEFATLAAEFSEDPGSAPTGGSLGTVGKGIFDPAFENALWALEEVGDVTEPVLSSFGYHIIRLDGIVAPTYPDFEMVKEDIETRLRREEAMVLFGERALEIERSVYDEGYSLDETAAAQGLTVGSAERVRRSTPDIKLGHPDLLEILFSDEVLDGRNSEPVEIDGDRIVVVRVANTYAPEPIPLADVEADISAALAREKAIAAIVVDEEEALAKLQEGASVTEVAESLGQQWRTFELASRGGSPEIPFEVISAAFSMPRPAEGDKSVDSVELANGAALVTVTRVVQGDINTTTDVELANIRRLTQARAARYDFQSFYQGAEERVGVARPSLGTPSG